MGNYGFLSSLNTARVVMSSPQNQSAYFANEKTERSPKESARTMFYLMINLNVKVQTERQIVYQERLKSQLASLDDSSVCPAF